MKQTLIFVEGTGVFSDAIEWKTGGPYSHVAMLWDESHVLDSTGNACGGKPAGVQIRPLSYLASYRQLWMELEVPDAADQAGREWIVARVGDPYDWPGIEGEATDRDWRGEGSWFCSEIQTRRLEIQGTLPNPMLTPANMVTPVTLATIYSAIRAVITRLP